MRQVAIAAIVAAALCGCATDGYRQFYTTRPGLTPDMIATQRAAPAPLEPQVAHAATFQGVADAYARMGYVAFASSSFSSGHNQRDRDAIKQAKNAGADLVVIIDPQYVGSQTSSVPITTPTTTTSVTNGTATAFGPGGAVTAFGNATTTTYGNRTTYIPVTIDRYDYGALYFVKRRYTLGANFRDLNDDERRQLQTNRGVFIISVVDGYPAYESDILPGDVVISVNGQIANGSAGFNEMVERYHGQSIEIAIIRQGKAITKSVHLLE